MNNSSESGKKPVLTSPWKIGMLVALLLIVVSCGAGYYLINVYNVNLMWLSEGSGRWNIDSYMFFKEMYPLAAGVILLSLFAYFIVASAVRRYKFYLSSGQDYRKMISLARSVDDLTNPAQIAKLSDYPELQKVLRNYGDQIREISNELGQMEKEYRSVDLEIEIESLIKGEDVQETLLEGKWWSNIFKKLKTFVDESRTMAKELEKKNNLSRRILGRTVLSHGKVMESIGEVSEGLLEIVRAVGELNSVAKGVETAVAGSSVKVIQAQDGMAAAIVGEIEKTVYKLEEGSTAMHRFSEENSGLALNIALMAARGGVKDRDLAEFAEKVRSTSERFGKLGGAVSSIGKSLLGSCQKLKENLGSASQAGAGTDPELQRAVSIIAMKIEDRSKILQQRICNLGSELQDIHEFLQRGMGEFSSPEDRGTDTGETAGTIGLMEPGEMQIVNFGAESKTASRKNTELVIDHGEVWNEGVDSGSGLGPFESAGEPALGGIGRDIAPREGDEITLGIAGDSEKPATAGAASQADFPERAAFLDAQAGSGLDRPGSGEGWMEMPGHRWIKIDVEKAAQESGKEAVDVEFRRPEMMADSRPERVSELSVAEKAEGAEGAPQPELYVSQEYEDDEPIYDLFELGAVEYVEETKIQG